MKKNMLKLEVLFAHSKAFLYLQVELQFNYKYANNQEKYSSPENAIH